MQGQPFFPKHSSPHNKQLYTRRHSRRTVTVLATSLSLVAVVHLAQAAPLGMPKSTAKIGYGFGGARISVDDPSGDTQTKWGVQPVTLIYSDWLVKDIRYWSEVYYFSTALKAGNTQVGQDVESAGLRFTLQKNFRVNQIFSPWFGGGVDLSQVNYSVRHTKDDEGFLIKTFDDRKESAVSLVFNVMNEWSVQKDWSVGVKLEQSIAVQSDISDFVATVNVLFRY